MLDFDEINKLTKLSYETSEITEVISDVESLMINAYVQGFNQGREDLNESCEIDLDDMYEAIYLMVGDKTWTERLSDYEGDFNRIWRVVETECNRVYNAGVYDAGRQIERNGGTVMKLWLTMLDDRVRETHDYLEMMFVPLGMNFYTYDGDSAEYPGRFSKAENNINCRCRIALVSEGRIGQGRPKSQTETQQ